ncbi:MAG: hypothetical protein FGM18_00575 [Burkholderiaceae bacterium]|nr:hypothetical protein [Burkholderiaceae bacterium]
MRVSSYQLLDAGIKSIQQQSVEAMKWQQQISSGNKYAKASDGAVAVARGVEIQFDQSKYKMLKANQDFVATRMALADAQLGAMHDVLADMQQMSVQARDAAIGKVGLQGLAQRARAAYEQLAQQAVAMDTNDERYLLRTTNVARLDQPKVASADESVSSAVIDADAVFHKAGTYKIDGFTTRSIGGSPEEFVTDARLQIAGLGPDGTSNTYYIGTYDPDKKILQFPQTPDAFFNLRLSIVGRPDAATELSFEANPVVLQLDKTARMHADGAFTVELNKGEQFLNGNFDTTGVVYQNGTATVAGWTATVGPGQTLEFANKTQTPFGSGSALILKQEGITSANQLVLNSTQPVNLLKDDLISFRWKTEGTVNAVIDAKIELIDSDGLVVDTKLITANSPDWSFDNTSLGVTKDGAYSLRVTSAVSAPVDPDIGDMSLYLDDIKVISDVQEITSATLKFNGEAVKTVTASDGGVAYNATTKTTSINFGNASNEPVDFYDLAFTMVGDPKNLRTTDTIAFRVDPKVKQIEVEPGIWVPEGISFREALGNTTATSRDVLADALAFVESLERAAVSGTLESDFTGKISNLNSATDQVLQYQIRAGVIGAQVDAAKAALDTKATELEAHRSRLLDTDIAEASAGLVRTQTLLEAARSIFARLESSNLFQRLM